MADDKAAADKAKLAAARKKAQKKAAEAKAKKAGGAAGKSATAKEDEPKDDATADSKEEDPTPATADEDPTLAEPEPAATADEPVAEELPPASTADTSELEAKIASLEKSSAAATSALEEAQLMTSALEKKVASLEMLHAEDESQIARLQSDLAATKSDLEASKKAHAEAEARELALSKKAAREGGGGLDDEHMDELEDEERTKLEARIRELEAENGELRRGVWLDRRKDMQPGMDDFTSVDLSSGSPGAAAGRQRGNTAGGGLGDFFTSGLNALTGVGGHPQHGHAHGHEGDDDGFLDDDDDFDEEAFRKAQEEAAKARIERIKEVKRGLKNWEGWRLDLVEGRRGGGEGIGEIFEV